MDTEILDSVQKEQTCPYCHPDSNGEYTMSSFTNDATGEKFVVGMYDERLTIGYHRPGFKTVRLVVEANYCLKCGRSFGGTRP